MYLNQGATFILDDLVMKKAIILTPALDKETHGKAPQKDHNRHDANLQKQRKYSLFTFSLFW